MLHKTKFVVSDSHTNTHKFHAITVEFLNVKNLVERKVTRRL